MTDFLIIQKQELLESPIIKLNFQHAESFLKDIPTKNETYIATLLMMSVMMLELTLYFFWREEENERKKSKDRGSLIAIRTSYLWNVFYIPNLDCKSQLRESKQRPSEEVPVSRVCVSSRKRHISLNLSRRRRRRRRQDNPIICRRSASRLNLFSLRSLFQASRVFIFPKLLRFAHVHEHKNNSSLRS